MANSRICLVKVLELGQCFCLMLKPLNLRLNVRMTKGMSLGREVAVTGSGFDDVVSMGFIKMLSKLACARTYTSAHFGWCQNS